MAFGSVLIALAVLFLAYSNGANDNFKGVATLFGSGTCAYRTALVWATLTTLAGSLLALVLAHELVETFKGRGLVPDSVTTDRAFLLAVSLGAALTVMLATWTGLPVSTTHALTGGLIGAGMLAADGEIQFASLGRLFVVPLLFSPLIALLLTVLVYPIFRRVRLFLGVTCPNGVRVGLTDQEVAVQSDGDIVMVRTGAVRSAGPAGAFVERCRRRILGLDAGVVLDGLHYLSGGAVGFARGLNDTPKIVALMIAGEALHPALGLTLVAVAMAVGGVLNSRRLAETLSKKITRMSPGQGFTANLVTSLLVASASHLGLPVSTTHVSVGALFGIGAVNGTARVRTVFTILLAWVTTLPIGASLAAIIYLLSKRLQGGG